MRILPAWRAESASKDLDRVIPWGPVSSESFNGTHRVHWWHRLRRIFDGRSVDDEPRVSASTAPALGRRLGEYLEEIARFDASLDVLEAALIAEDGVREAQAAVAIARRDVCVSRAHAAVEWRSAEITPELTRLGESAGALRARADQRDRDLQQTSHMQCATASSTSRSLCHLCEAR